MSVILHCMRLSRSLFRLKGLTLSVRRKPSDFCIIHQALVLCYILTVLSGTFIRVNHLSVMFYLPSANELFHCICFVESLDRDLKDSLSASHLNSFVGIRHIKINHKSFKVHIWLSEVITEGSFVIKPGCPPKRIIKKIKKQRYSFYKKCSERPYPSVFIQSLLVN